MLNFGFFKTYCLPPTANLYSGLEIESGVRVTAHCSKANKETRLVEGKFYFILDANNQGGVQTVVQKAVSPPTPHPRPVGNSFYRLREGATCRKSSQLRQSS